MAFLDRCKPDVEELGIEMPAGELHDKLVEFAVGDCEDTERPYLCNSLKKRPTWVRWVARQVTDKRGSAGVEPHDN